MTCRIAILGDFNPVYSTHHSLNDSVRQVVKKFNEDLQLDWIGTDTFNFKTAFSKLYSGLWVAPGSPYKDAANVINTIKHARENEIPTFGNCGGFQHMVIEFARNVCGITYADHEEMNPDSGELVISKLACSLKEQEEELTITDTSSLLSQILKREKLIGRYYCNYGINEKYVDQLRSNGLSPTARSNDNSIRAFEIKSHPFFVGTLFQPALTSTFLQPDPIITAFVEFCLKRKFSHKYAVHHRP